MNMDNMLDVLITIKYIHLLRVFYGTTTSISTPDFVRQVLNQYCPF